MPTEIDTVLYNELKVSIFSSYEAMKSIPEDDIAQDAALTTTTTPTTTGFTGTCFQVQEKGPSNQCDCPLWKNEGGVITCRYCKKKGHAMKDCHKKKHDKKKKNNANTNGDVSLCVIIEDLKSDGPMEKTDQVHANFPDIKHKDTYAIEGVTDVSYADVQNINMAHVSSLQVVDFAGDTRANYHCLDTSCALMNSCKTTVQVCSLQCH